MTTALFLSLVGLVPAQQNDWPEFLGPDRTGKVELSGVSFDWGEDGPGVVWAAPTGPGYGGCAVRDGEVYLLDREVGVKDILRVFDLETGEEKWTAEYPATGRLNFPGSRTVPSVQEKHVYTCGGQGRVTCFDRESGEEVWSIDMVETYGGEMPIFGWSNSPLVVDDLVVISPLGDEIGLVALDRFSGEEAWVTEGIGYSHSTPVLMELLGKEQILFMSTMAQGGGQDQAAPSTISSFDPKYGDLIWRTETTLTRLPIPPPVRVDDERFFLTGGYRGGSTLMHIAKGDGGYELEEVFHIERGAQVHAPIIHEEHVYVLVNENWNNDSRGRQQEGGLLCLSLDGKEVWRTAADPFFGRGNAVLAGEHLLIQDGFNGVLRVARATPEGYQQVAEANVFGVEDRRDHQMWAPMALAGRKLLIRSQEELLCVEL